MWSWLAEHGEQIRIVFVAVCEILILWIAFYQAYRAFHATRGANILLGLISCLMGLTILTVLLQLTVLSWLLKSLFTPALLIALVVIFQPELRMALARMGRLRDVSVFGFTIWGKTAESDFVEKLAAGVTNLSNKRYGALIALRRSNELTSIIETGTLIDGIFTRELIGTIFFPKTPLHDGGVILDHERIVAAACVFPVSAKEMKDRSIGLRHRAAVGLSEESDAVVIVISEETGAVSLSFGGRLERNVDINYLKTRLKELLYEHTLPQKTQDVAQP
ncbi:MAG: diadenylate cyclase CdaA [Akkermansiaceae bacterium]|nr:diadenylate cyclase CdaA [Akkermansia sp.]MCD7798862.1 diadenylate cyclase CdaA [Akkermansiaceae bacterium]MCD8071509.1 diadenylate cyclase CdaA [Akkermansiaceae bacterium]